MKLTDKRGKGLRVGSWVRVESSIGLKAWRGTVKEFQGEKALVYDPKRDYNRWCRITDIVTLLVKGKKVKRRW